MSVGCDEPDSDGRVTESADGDVVRSSDELKAPRSGQCDHEKLGSSVLRAKPGPVAQGSNWTVSPDPRVLFNHSEGNEACEDAMYGRRIVGTSPRKLEVVLCCEWWSSVVDSQPIGEPASKSSRAKMSGSDWGIVGAGYANEWGCQDDRRASRASR